MLFENFPLPLPWYPSVTLQDRFRQNVAVNAVITQLAPMDGLLPFQFRKTNTSAVPESWKIKCAENGVLQDYLDGYEDSTVVDLSAFIFTALEWETLVDTETTDHFDYFIFKNESNSLALILGALADGLPAGVYYLQMDFGDEGKWCSETFRVPVDRFTWDVPTAECNYPCFKWSHNTDIKPMHYNVGDTHLFYNLLYLDTFITASEPEYLTQGKNDGREEFHATFQKLVIKYRISAFIPDYIKVALYAFLMHENKFLFTEKSLREGEVKNVEVTSSLSTDGALSTVEILFQQISLIVQTNCADNLDEEICGPMATDDFDIDTRYCDVTGDVSIALGFSPTPGIYGELWGKIAGVWTLVYSYISWADLVAGANVVITGSLGVTKFRLRFRTFACSLRESTDSTPVADCV